MSLHALALRADPYPQRRNSASAGWVERVWLRLRTAQRAFAGRSLPLFNTDWPRQLQEAQQHWLNLSEAGAIEEARELCARLRREGLANDTALVKAVAWVGLKAETLIGMAPYPQQLHTACLLLRGCLVELDTGEGKSLAAALAAACAAWAGIPVHVITVNDYLVDRDARAFAPLYAALGLSIETVLETTPAAQRARAYQAEVVYVSNKTVAFDYLRDRTLMQDRLDAMRVHLQAWSGRGQRPRMRGLAMAIIDEADSVLIDEARTPLILSSTTPQPLVHRFYEEAMRCAAGLEIGVHVLLRDDARELKWLPEGLECVQSWMPQHEVSALWQGRLRREEAVLKALQALHLYRRDVDYIVRDDKVLIVDENTGRVMPDRSWESGLHQMIEIKEAVAITDERETLARISYQQFFPRYLVLSGMTGTCREVASEVAQVYQLPVVRIEPRVPSRRQGLARHVHADAQQRWSSVVSSIAQRARRGQPVLVGLRTIQACDELSRRLDCLGLAHEVLHARQDEQEARLVSQAGHRGQITLATNMGGRGTDIRLTDETRALGGLHVILTEMHESRRIDRQLIGRCARQGDPGSWEAHVSLDDELFQGFMPLLRQALKKGLGTWPGSGFVHSLAWLYTRAAQRAVQRRHFRIRLSLRAHDDRMRTVLGFTGMPE